ncbi:unnamed protein product [Mytilus edulis]|uniref:PHD-type domain-containing protein n=1 Tax=Mytilus edulis TaxID=6550 RepID=A0A8S3QDR7_MYTED|nr:unnamed protein product [Mytilus edulis]
MLEERQKSVSEPSKTNQLISKIDPAKCLKCKRNVQTKGVYCSAGEHWIHYRCARLKDADISALKDNNTNNFCCIICTESKSDQHTNLPKLKTRDILLEEIQTICSVCDTRVNNKSVNCEMCLQSCHMDCLSTICPSNEDVNDASNDTNICLNFNNVTNQQLQYGMPDNQDFSHRQHRPNITTIEHISVPIHIGLNETTKQGLKPKTSLVQDPEPVRTMMSISPVIVATEQHKDAPPISPNIIIDKSPSLQNINVDGTTPL